MFTGTRSSLTWVHLTVPELEVVTWKTSAHNLQIGMLKKESFYTKTFIIFYVFGVEMGPDPT